MVGHRERRLEDRSARAQLVVAHRLFDVLPLVKFLGELALQFRVIDHRVIDGFLDLQPAAQIAANFLFLKEPHAVFEVGQALVVDAVNQQLVERNLENGRDRVHELLRIHQELGQPA